MMINQSPGLRLRQALELAADQQQILPFVGIYDLFSASLAADRFEALFLSGFGLDASALGLPDIGFIGWGWESDDRNWYGLLSPVSPAWMLFCQDKLAGAIGNMIRIVCRTGQRATSSCCNRVCQRVSANLKGLGSTHESGATARRRWTATLGQPSCRSLRCSQFDFTVRR